MRLATTPQQYLTLSTQLITTSPATTKISVTHNANTLGKGTVVLKTYDPASGALVKFKTNKIADVGRMVAVLGRLGRVQAGLGDEEPKVEEADKMQGVETEAKEEAKPEVKKVDIEVRPAQGGKKKGKKGKK